MKRLATAMFTVLFLTCSIAGASAATVINRVVAVVGKEVITSMDLERAMRILQARFSRLPPAQRQQRMTNLRRHALEGLIGEKLFLAEVKRLKITVSNRELDSYIERVKRNNRMTEEEFIAQLKARGTTPEEYRQRLKRDILKQKLVRSEVHSKVVISDTQVEAYYKAHKEDFSQPGKITLQAIFFTAKAGAKAAEIAAMRKNAEAVLQQVKKGADFAALARRFSNGPGRAEGGRLGPVSGQDLLDPMREALEKLKPGEVAPLVEIPGGFVIVKLLAKGDSGSKGLQLDSVREQIRNRLEKEALEQRFQSWMKELRGKSYVRIIN